MIPPACPLRMDCRPTFPRLTQSAQNVTDGVGMLQTADGALSQVTTLLNRAVTLATEAANGGLDDRSVRCNHQ